MQDVLKTILTPTWIVSTLIGSVVLSILSAYLTRGLDKLLAAFSRRAAKASTRRAEARKAFLARLRTDLSYRQNYRIMRLCLAYMAALGAFGGIVLFVATSLGDVHHPAGWSVAARVGNLLFGLLILFVAQASGLACWRMSIRLIESEAIPDRSDTAEAPNPEPEVAAKQP